MIKFYFLFTLILLISGCSKPPSYEFMVKNFHENKPAFAMIASLACEIGKKSGKHVYTISGKIDEERTILLLADTVNVDRIRFEQQGSRCTLSMGVWENQDNGSVQKYAYRYNIAKPAPYKETAHAYQRVVERLRKREITTATFDMTLAKHWFFTFLYTVPAK